MGVYDSLPNGSQVKCWGCEMITKKIGDTVCPARFSPDDSGYVVLLREGGYVRVQDGIITEIVEDGVPRYPDQFDVPCIDKYGSEITEREDLVGGLQGVVGMDDPYFFK